MPSKGWRRLFHGAELNISSTLNLPFLLIVSNCHRMRWPPGSVEATTRLALSVISGKSCSPPPLTLTPTPFSMLIQAALDNLKVGLWDLEAISPKLISPILLGGLHHYYFFSRRH